MLKEIQEAGLSKNETKTYLSLLELGLVTAKEISVNIGIHRSNAYEALQRLSEKGLISEVMHEGKKHYSANDPESLLLLLDQKRSKIIELVPELKALQKFTTTLTNHSVDVYQGSSGLKQILNIILKVGQPVYSFGIPQNISEKMKYYVSNYHFERISRKIPQFHLYDEDAAERIKYLNSLDHTSAKVFKGSIKSPCTTTIFGDYVTFWIWSNPEFLLLIKSEAMAQAYKTHFDILWNMS